MAIQMIYSGCSAILYNYFNEVNYTYWGNRVILYLATCCLYDTSKKQYANSLGHVLSCGAIHVACYLTQGKKLEDMIREIRENHQQLHTEVVRLARRLECIDIQTRRFDHLNQTLQEDVKMISIAVGRIHQGMMRSAESTQSSAKLLTTFKGYVAEMKSILAAVHLSMNKE